MLKIKDGINLRVLLNYGFEYCGDCRWLRRYAYVSRCGTTTNRIWVKRDKILSFNNPTNKVFNVLYDLIKADLVEKVEE